MKQLRKKIMIGILFFIILVGVFGVVFFSSKFIDRFQKAVAHNEEDNIELLSSEEEETEEISTEANESILTYEDTVNAVSAGAEETYEPLSSVATIENLTNQNYSILTYDDWTKLKLFSNESTLEGKVFHIYYPDNSSSAKTWVLSGAHIGEGLGSDNYPFSGTLKPYYDGMNLQTSVTLFYSLSSKAGIISKNNQNPFTIENAIYGSSSTEGGLAKKFVLEDESVDLLNNYKNVKIKGNIDSTKTAGGLFGTITNNGEPG